MQPPPVTRNIVQPPVFIKRASGLTAELALTAHPLLAHHPGHKPVDREPACRKEFRSWREEVMKCSSVAVAGAAAALIGAMSLPAQASDIIAEWASVKAPPPTAVKAVNVDPKTTALLMLD